MTANVMGSSPAKGSPNSAVKCFTFGHRNNRGGPCAANVIKGTTGCWRHAGKAKDKAKAEGAVIVELHRWGLDGHTTLRDAGEVLLRLVTQSAARVEMYSRLLAEAYEAGERLRQASETEQLLTAAAEEREPDDEDGVVTEPPAIQAARADLQRIFATGGVGALIGVKRDADRFGRIYETEESIRGLARLEAEERDRCANFAAKAVAAGLAERQVRLAESQGAQMLRVFGRVLEALGLSLQDPAVVAILEREIRALTAGPIEGSVVNA